MNTSVIYIVYKFTDITLKQAYLRENVVSVPDHCNKLNTAIK